MVGFGDNHPLSLVPKIHLVEGTLESGRITENADKALVEWITTFYFSIHKWFIFKCDKLFFCWKYVVKKQWAILLP